MAADSGLTRLAFELMTQRIPMFALADMTQIPAPLLSQYACGRRVISRHHLVILSIALDCPANELRKNTPPALVVVDEDEWGNENPMPMYRIKKRIYSY